MFATKFVAVNGGRSNRRFRKRHGGRHRPQVVGTQGGKRASAFGCARDHRGAHRFRRGANGCTALGAGIAAAIATTLAEQTHAHRRAMAARRKRRHDRPHPGRASRQRVRPERRGREPAGRERHDRFRRGCSFRSRRHHLRDLRDPLPCCRPGDQRHRALRPREGLHPHRLCRRRADRDHRACLARGEIARRARRDGAT
jgi:hypothetical protein